MDDRRMGANPVAPQAAAGARAAARCRDLPAGIADDGPAAALEAVREQLGLLLASDAPPDACVVAAQALRESAAGLHEQAASVYCGREIPLAAPEHDLWCASVEVRLAAAAVYEKSLLDQRNRAQCTRQWQALVCQRALRELDLVIVDHARARVAVPDGIWERLHGLYRYAETHGILEMGAAGPDAGSLDCRSTYLHALLFHRAQPYSLTGDQIGYVARWLESWARLAVVHGEVGGDKPLSALAVDLDGMDGLNLLRQSKAGPGLRHVDTQALGSELKRLSLAMREDAQVTSRQLAADLAAPVLARLLTGLYVQWCSAGTGRTGERSASSAKAMVTLTIPAIHFYISGRAFRQPGQGPTIEEDQDLHLFGHITQRTTQKLVSQRSSAFEPWSISNESTSGMFALCRQPDFRTRIAHGQLLGLMKRSDMPIELVMVQRLVLAGTGELEVGVRRIPGIPQAVAVRVATPAPPRAAMFGNPEGKFERALLLPEVAEKSLPPRLFLQPGWYRPQCLLDLYVHQKATIRLLDLIEKGPNFEQVTFDLV